jgi:hypothetical protein
LTKDKLSAAWDEMAKILAKPLLANDIIQAAEKIHRERSKNSEETRIQSRIDTLKSQIEVLAERLSILPKSVSPDPIYRQMEKLEAMKVEEEKRRQGRPGGVKELDTAVELTFYQALLAGLNTLRTKDETSCTKIIQTLIHGGQITREGFKIHYYAGRSQIEGAWAQMLASGGVASDILLSRGSNSVINGGATKNRSQLLALHALGSRPRLAALLRDYGHPARSGIRQSDILSSLFLLARYGTLARSVFIKTTRR